MTLYLVRRPSFLVVTYGTLLVHVHDDGEIQVRRQPMADPDEINRLCWDQDLLSA